MPEGLSLPIAVLALFVAIYVLVIGVYALGSFLFMRPQVAARRLGVSLAELLREVWAAAWTQALLPLFYLVGRRLDRLVAPSGEARPGAVPVVFVHGYAQNRVCFLGLARALARGGVRPLYALNYPWLASLDYSARKLARFVDAICEETGAPHVDLVCHSMGGLVAVEFMRGGSSAVRERVRRCVTIATPHGGVSWRGPILGVRAANMRRGSPLLAEHAAYRLSIPFLSIYSTHDNIVFPKETSMLAARGGRDVEVPGVAHMAILFSPRVAEHVETFLTEADPPPIARTMANEPPGATVAVSEPVTEPGQVDTDAVKEPTREPPSPPPSAV